MHEILKTNKLQKDSVLLYANSTTQPYWLIEAHSKGKFNVSDFNLTGFPENPNAPQLSFGLRINGENMTFNQPIQYKYTDPVRGEIYNPIVILPQLSAKSSSPLALTQNAAAVEVNLTFHKNGMEQAGTFNIISNVPQGWEVSPASFDLSFDKGSNTATKQITIKPIDRSKSSIDTLSFQLAKKEYLKDISPILFIFRM